MNKEKYAAMAALSEKIQRTRDTREPMRLAKERDRAYEYGVTSDEKIACPISKAMGIV